LVTGIEDAAQAGGRAGLLHQVNGLVQYACRLLRVTLEGRTAHNSVARGRAEAAAVVGDALDELPREKL
jgi:hypothetical protein